MSDSIAATGTHRSASRRAGLVRVGFALAAILFAGSLFPNLAHAGWVFASYLGFALAAQLCIVRGIGAGDTRSLVSGSVDTAFLTYVVYELGMVSNVLPFIYLLIPVLHASSSSSRSRVGMRLALLTSGGYTTLLILTALGVVPYAPARQDIVGFVPSVPLLVMSGALVVLSVLVTTNLVSRQVTALGQMNAKLAELSQRDELTQLYNRRYLMQTLAHHLARVRRGASVGLMMIDLDGFKRVNDLLGHAAGDALLREVARGLEEEMRQVDLVARYGGDEFVVLLPDVDPRGLTPAAERAVARVAAIGRARHPELPVTASVGVTLAWPDDEVSSVLRRADEHAYLAKRAGGNRRSSGSYHRHSGTVRGGDPQSAAG